MKDILKSNLEELINILDRIPTEKEFINKYGHRYTIRKLFGIWGLFVEDCGHKPLRKRYSSSDKCKINGCSNNIKAMYLCDKHYNNYLRNNRKVKESRERPNKIVMKNNYVEVWTNDMNGSIKDRVLVDAGSLDKISGYKVSYGDMNGAMITIGKKRLRLAVHLFGELNNELLYTYKNKDRRDCRKNNIEVVNRGKLAQNNKIQKNNKTGYKGISKTKSGKYMSRIGVNNKEIYLGCFETIEEAIYIREKGEEKYWKKNISKSD